MFSTNFQSSRDYSFLLYTNFVQAAIDENIGRTAVDHLDLGYNERVLTMI